MGTDYVKEEPPAAVYVVMQKSKRVSTEDHKILNPKKKTFTNMYITKKDPINIL